MRTSKVVNSLFKQGLVFDTRVLLRACRTEESEESAPGGRQKARPTAEKKVKEEKTGEEESFEGKRTSRAA
jgi:hypothetical protein